jgi:hypothetical protein
MTEFIAIMRPVVITNPVLLPAELYEAGVILLCDGQLVLYVGYLGVWLWHSLEQKH